MKRVIAASIIVLSLITANIFRFNTEATKSVNPSTHTKWVRDRWTGELWTMTYSHSGLQQISSGKEFIDLNNKNIPLAIHEIIEALPEIETTKTGLSKLIERAESAEIMGEKLYIDIQSGKIEPTTLSRDDKTRVKYYMALKSANPETYKSAEDLYKAILNGKVDPKNLNSVHINEVGNYLAYQKEHKATYIWWFFMSISSLWLLLEASLYLFKRNKTQKDEEISKL